MLPVPLYVFNSVCARACEKISRFYAFFTSGLWIIVVLSSWRRQFSRVEILSLARRQPFPVQYRGHLSLHSSATAGSSLARHGLGKTSSFSLTAATVLVTPFSLHVHRERALSSWRPNLLVSAIVTALKRDHTECGRHLYELPRHSQLRNRPRIFLLPRPRVYCESFSPPTHR